MTTAAAGADVIVVGRGTAGCVVGARLSENPGRRVTLIEAGADYRSAQTPAVLHRDNLARALASRAVTWRAGGDGDRAAGPTAGSYPTGRGVGDTSAMNGQLSLWPLAADFAAWPTGWGWPDVAPRLAALECDLDFALADLCTHGSAPALQGVRRGVSQSRASCQETPNRSSTHAKGPKP